MKETNKSRIVIAAIIILGLALRLYGIDWDQGNHLHPDERSITMTSNALDVPSGLFEYLDPIKSPLNPYNRGKAVYVYGTLPLTMIKLTAAALNMDDYNGTTQLGRHLSALFDTLTILLVFLIARIMTRLYHLDPHTPLYAAVLYGVAVLPIQLAHLFASDSFLCFFMAAASLFVMRVRESGRWRDVCLTGLFLGCAVGTKITAVFLMPVILGFLLPRPAGTSSSIKRHLLLVTVRIGLCAAVTCLAVRIADPHVFAGPGIFSLRISPKFIENLRMLSNISNPDSTYPPSIQWRNTTPVWFALRNMARYGLGYVYFAFAVVGLIFFGKGVHLRSGWKQWDRFIIPLWITAFFLYQSTRYVKALRYFIFLYPFLAIFAAVGLGLFGWIKNREIRRVALATAWILILIWPLSFIGIYSRCHTRVDASRWIYQHVPPESFLAEENWDDVMPVRVPGIEKRKYDCTQMPVFDPDNSGKINGMEDALRRADYIILSSNRGYGAIPKMPEKFPYTCQFYKDLFSERLEFFRVAEFTSYPAFNLGFVRWEFRDDKPWTDETFTVYDHPKVIIFKRKDGDESGN
ncbi:glycosyltransferase family 39 protein [bacterium]|nr:glycosyltransferase family 39 protein [candidate division CSSED10-310 bacterium]